MIISTISPITSLSSFYKNANQSGFANISCAFSSAKKAKKSDIQVNGTVPKFERDSYYNQLLYIDKYVNPKVVKKAIKKNPNITKILNEHGLTPRISKKNINEQAKMHMFATYLYAKDVAESIKLDEKKSETLCNAALLHDIGKSLIPKEIVQKPSKLTPDERKIIDLHSELGYEILKTTDVPIEVAKLVKDHHESKENKRNDKISLILSVVDVFSALKEKRVYKPAMQDKEAFDIMKESEKLSQFFVYVLKGCRNKK